MKQTRHNTYWTNSYGRKIKVCNLSDLHLANIIWFFKTGWYPKDMMKLLREEVKLRGLSRSFMESAQVPHVDPIGHWRMWDEKKGTNVLVSKKKAKI